MNSALTFTLARSTSSTMTQVRVRNVMLEVGSDFCTMEMAGLVNHDTCVDWRIDLVYLLENEALKSFQLQLKCAGRAPVALEYTVKADGSLQSSDKAGGIAYFALPAGTKANLFITLSDKAKSSTVVKEYLRKRNWGFDGEAVIGNVAQDRVYSADGYGVVRNKIGTWP